MKRMLSSLARAHPLFRELGEDPAFRVALGSPRLLSGGSLQQLLHAAQTCESSRREAVTRLLHDWGSDSYRAVPGRNDGQAQLQQVQAQAQANELLRLCARQQAVDDAMQVIAAMERRGVTPDAETFAQLHDVFTYFPQPMKPTTNPSGAVSATAASGKT